MFWLDSVPAMLEVQSYASELDPSPKAVEVEEHALEAS
jgi:hypothetical protein